MRELDMQEIEAVSGAEVRVFTPYVDWYAYLNYLLGNGSYYS